MSSEFRSWDDYFWEPGGEVLRNLWGERDAKVLADREYAETAKQAAFIETGITRIDRTFSASHLQAIHYALFKNIYAWAGEFRAVPISKGFTDFAIPAEIPRYLQAANAVIKETDWANLGRVEFAETMAWVFAYINQAHPFREGNGRVSKIFMHHIAELSRFTLDFRPESSGITPEIWNNASALSGPDRGTFEPVPDSLVPVFYNLAKPKTA
ncbi:MAG: Fic family protein [Microbacteriaceae bacterium]|nr:Fic family protein [Microbacteriaceae bacterium]